MNKDTMMHLATATVEPVKRGKKGRPAAPVSAAKASSISIRIDDLTRTVIDRAASVLGQSRSEFMLGCARQYAEDVLLDRRYFLLGDADWDAFTRDIETPPPTNAELKALLSRTPAWER